MPECHRRAVRDRSKNAWWLLVFYVVPGVLGQSAKGTWVAGGAGMGLHYILALAGFALSIWGFIEIGCLSGNAGSNRYGSNPLPLRGAENCLFGSQSCRPAKTIVEACGFHYQNGSQHKYYLHQRSGGKNPVQQRHAMLRCGRIGYRNARYNRSLDAIP